MSTPDTIPFILVSMNGTEQKLKEKHYFAMLEGQEYELNVRATFDGSSPHTEDDEEGLLEW